MDTETVFHIREAEAKELPILLSVPHSGTELPSDVKNEFAPDYATNLPDTDWLVHEIYDFAPKMGITVICARYSRYLIDLNRNPEDRSLYSDGRNETQLVPARSFSGEFIYNDQRPRVDEKIKNERIKKYFQPYYAEITRRLQLLREKFGEVLLYDAHSIRRRVASISDQPFPDIILGSNDGLSASADIVEFVWSELKRSSYSVSHNSPFRGGQITRHFGRPDQNIHALQMERSQDIYLCDDESNMSLDPLKTKKLRQLLQPMLGGVAAHLLRRGAK